MFALSFVLMLVLVLAELLILKHARGRPIPWRDVVFNLNSGHILMWLLRGVEVLAFSLVLKYANLHVVERWHPAAQWAFAFVAWDFCFYWMHRMHHAVPLLWSVHVVHHEGEHFNLSLGIRNSWYSSLTNFPFVAVLAVLGVPLEIFVLVSTVHYSVQFYNHNGLVNKSGLLDRFMVTPSNHRVHHGMDARYINRNFGGTLLLWDKLFGSYQPELDGVEMRYGVAGTVASDNPFWANNGWLRRQLQARFPGFGPGAHFGVPDLFIGIGGVILFGVVIFYVNMDGRLPKAQYWQLFALVFSGTIALGGLSDGRRWGALGWTALALATPLLFLAVHQLRDPFGVVCLLALAGHGFDSLRRLVLPGAAPARRADA